MKIQFLKNTESAIIKDIPTDTFIIYKEGYKIPETPKINDAIEFDKFRQIYSNLHTNKLIFIGLNKIITPSNRCDFIFEYLFTLSTDVEKMSIDNSPFEGEPWRIWFHYGLCNCGNFGVPYSYSIETEWKAWFYKNRNDSRFEADNIKLCLSDTYSDLSCLLYKSEFYEVDNKIFEWYENCKKAIFEKYNSPKLLISNLLKKVNKKFNLNFNFDTYRNKNKAKSLNLFDTNENTIKLPNLKIYRFIDEENKRRLMIYNTAINLGKRNENL